MFTDLDGSCQASNFFRQLVDRLLQLGDSVAVGVAAATWYKIAAFSKCDRSKGSKQKIVFHHEVHYKFALPQSELVECFFLRNALLLAGSEPWTS